MSRSLKYLLILFCLITCISSCSVKYLPLGDVNARVVGEAYLYRDQDTELVAENRYWSQEPQNLDDYFTTFYVSVKNLTDRKIDVNRSDFALLSENGSQYDPLDVQDIEDVLLPNQLENLIINNIEDQEEDKLVTLNEQRNTLDDWRRAKKNLLADSFYFGEIYPNARRSGFLFFPRIKSINEKVTLIYRGKELRFGR